MAKNCGDFSTNFITSTNIDKFDSTKCIRNEIDPTTLINAISISCAKTFTDGGKKCNRLNLRRNRKEDKNINLKRKRDFPKKLLSFNLNAINSLG